MNFIARFLPSLAPGISAFLNPWVFLVAIVLAAAGFAAGVKVEGWRWDASVKDIADANVAYLKRYAAHEREVDGTISARREAELTKLAKDKRALQEKLNHATDHRPQGTILTVAADPAPTGGAPGAGEPTVQGLNLATTRLRITCDRACVGLWNDALAQGLPDTYGAWRADAQAASPDSVSETDLFRNAAENFALANDLRSQLLSWQRKACAEGWAAKDQCSKGLTQ